MLFGKKKRTIKVGNEIIELEPKPGLFSFRKPKAPNIPSSQSTVQQSTMQYNETSIGPSNAPQYQEAIPNAQTAGQYQKQNVPQKGSKPSRFRLYLEGVGAKRKGLDLAVSEHHIKGTIYEFVKRMFYAALSSSILLAVIIFALFLDLKMSIPASALFAILLGFVIFKILFNMFLNYPTRRGIADSRNVERDILFAARDMIISLRSGMPLFDAIVSVSTGYGEASKEFARIVSRVQLGEPLEKAIDDAVAETKSVSFRRIMLQASVSIKAGADVVSALQSMIDQISQERIIELRRYGQRLNAIAMFYMLFGVILPSMGIAVVTILTTFISIISVTTVLLAFVLVFLLILQIIFLAMIRSSRPVFSM
ncbi:MAG: type II secretion system F family protein [Candidatus Micrarchaeia archaeon]